MRALLKETRSASLLVAGILLLLAQAVTAAELHVVSSGGFAAAYRLLGPEFEKREGHTLMTSWGPSMGETAEAIPNRLSRGEPIDVVIMVGSSLDDLIKQGKVAGDSKAILASSKIAVAIKSGTPAPDISTVEHLKQALLNARSIAYSDSASGVYLSTVLFPRLGIAEQIRNKARMIPAEPVAKVVARGEAEIGFQQLSELIPEPGIQIVGLLPEEAQKVTLFSAGVVTDSKQPQAARALVQFLASPAASPTIKVTGLEPASGSNSK